jgi:TP901 family phage tail tape measure protein
MVATGLNSGNTIEVQIEGDSSGLDAAIANARAGLDKLKLAVGAVGGALSALAAGGLVQAINATRQFEEALVELEKVTDPQTAREMSSAIRDMAATIPLAQTELAALAADAARFGVRGPKNIRAFTETVAKMATATNLGTQQAGEALAKLATLTNTPIERIGNLGSAINSLSNNFATSSQEIVDSMLRSSAALSQLGLSATEISSLSASLNAVSESSERAGTRLRRLAQEIQSPGKHLEDMATAAGLTVEEFKRMRQENPKALIMELAEALNESETQTKALNRAFSTTSRQALAGFAQNMRDVANASELASKSFKEATSLQREFDAQTQTFNAQLQLLQNQLRNNAIAIGNVFLPQLTALLKRVRQYIAAEDTLIDRLSAQQKAWGLVATAVGGAALLISQFVSGPLGALILGLGALGTAWQTNFLGMRDATRSTINAINGLFAQHETELRALQTTARDTTTGIRDAFRTVRDAAQVVFRQFLMPLFAELAGVVRTHFGAILTEISETFQVIQVRLRAFGQAFNAFWQQWGDEITAVARVTWDVISTILTTALDAMLTGLRVFLNVFQGDWQEAYAAVEGFTRRTGDRLVGMWGNILNGIKEAVIGFGNWLIFGSYVPSMLNAVLGAFGSFGSQLRGRVSSILGGVASVFQSKLSQVRRLADDIIAEARSAMRQADGFLGDARDAAEDAVDAAQRAARAARRRSRSRSRRDDDDDGGPDYSDIYSGGGGGSSTPSSDDQYGGARPPGLQSGGIVTASSLPAILHGPEAVMPLDKLPGIMADAMLNVGSRSRRDGRRPVSITVSNNEFHGVENAEDVAEEIFKEANAHL